MRVLVTGGAGFIGGAIARSYLARGAAVTVVDSLVTGRREWVPDGAAFHALDIRDPALERIFDALGPFDVVSHHAALKDVRKALVDPRADAAANILGTLNVLRAAADHRTGRFIFASSAAVYGDAAALPTPESAPVAPISPYGISKAAAEAYCAYFARQRGLEAVALRYGTVYGPAATEESEAGVITVFARRMLAGSRPVIYGAGDQTRDLVHVDDVVRANLLAAERAPRPWAAYNVASGTETSVNDLYRLLAERIGFGGAPDYREAKPGEVHRNAQDAALIARDLGWVPQIPLEEGLANVVHAYRAALRAELGPPSPDWPVGRLAAAPLVAPLPSTPSAAGYWRTAGGGQPGRGGQPRGPVAPDAPNVPRDAGPDVGTPSAATSQVAACDARLGTPRPCRR